MEQIAEDFGQKVDLTARLREILVNYPEGTSILKELVQNADDAGATKITFCLDHRQHGTASLAYEKLAPFQGPALYVHNNSVFSEADFQSISRIGDSGKSRQAGKTGRFGVGWNSCYHLTDLPSFVSAGSLVLFDPHCSFLPNVSSVNPGKRIKFVQSAVLDTYRDQFEPYATFGCDMRSHYSGTLFRFPLRSASLAEQSRISKQVYTPEKVKVLLQALHQEAFHIMLFLKSVQCLEVVEWQAGAASPVLQYSCRVQNASQQLQQSRGLFQRAAQEWAAAGKGTSQAGIRLSGLHIISFEGVVEGQPESRQTQSYLVSQLCGQGAAAAAAREASAQFRAPVIPWGAVAAPLEAGTQEGHAFCFLPLPVQTGLPVHVNAFFELSSNRRDIWFGDDMTGTGKLRSEWNLCLLREVLAPAYAAALAAAAEQLGACTAYWALWPQAEAAQPWRSLVLSLFSHLKGQPVVPVAASGAWVAPQQAVYLDDAMEKQQDLLSALKAVQMPFSQTPQRVKQALLQHAVAHPRMLQPAMVRAHIRQRTGAAREACTADPSRAATLCNFCLSDLGPAEAGSWREVEELPILPMADGTLTSIQPAGRTSTTIFVCTGVDAQLLAALPHLCLRVDSLDAQALERLQAFAAQGSTNLVLLTSQQLVKLRSLLLPQQWRDDGPVQWTPGQDGHPSEAFLGVLWQKLQAFEDLQPFYGWHLLPVGSGLLHPLLPHEDSCALSTPAEGSWSPQLTAAVQKLEVRLVAQSPSCRVGHPQLHCCLHPANGRGLLAALQVALGPAARGEWSARLQQRGLEASDRRELRRYLIQQRWWQPKRSSRTPDATQHNDASLVGALKALPIFELARDHQAPATVSRLSQQQSGSFDSLLHQITHHPSSESTPSASFIDLIGSRFLPPTGLTLTKALPDDFIMFGDSEQLVVYIRTLGVKQPNQAALFRNHLLPRLAEMEDPLRDAVLVDMLHQLPTILGEDSTMAVHLGSLAFVPTADGNLQMPRELYDPRNPELVYLLDGRQFFPAGVFGRNEALLAALQQLGLRSAVTPDTLLDSAHFVEQLSATDEEAAYARATVLLGYLDVEACRLFGGRANNHHLRKLFTDVGGFLKQGKQAQQQVDAAKFWVQLSNIKWCPVLQKSPAPGLPWPPQQDQLAPPRAVRPQADMWLCSSCMRILDGQCRSAALCEGLGWTGRPGGSIIAAQLMELGKLHQGGTDVSTAQLLSSAVPEIYRALTSLDEHDMEVARAVLGTASCIWVGMTFAPANRVAMRGPLNLAPWLYVIPGDLASFKELFLQLGVHDGFAAPQYLGMLNDLAEVSHGEALSPAELEQAISVVQALCDMSFSAAQLFVPDARGSLAPAGEMVYNDAPWLDHGQEHRFVHPKLSHEVAERLGVTSLRRQMLAQSADIMQLGLSSAEAFGQSEALTTRLKHIIDAYPDGPGILMELIQNADDAGADEVAFLLDEQQYSSNSILGPGMRHWQGPALVCYNDSEFSPADFQNISRIGQDSKLEKPGATGRFGLGFNAVYNLTDLPSIVSGDHIVMFDPHAKYLPGTNAAQPGLKMNFQRANLLGQFPDSFLPYTHFGCTLRRHFEGTLFRFPLRSEATARMSDIKPTAYTPQAVRALFTAFQAQASSSLLFLKNVCKVALFTRSADNPQPQLVYRASVNAAQGQGSLQKDIARFVGGSGTRSDKDAFLNKLARTYSDQLPSVTGQLTVTAEDGQGQRWSSEWLICNALGGGKAQAMAAASRGQSSRGLVPWVGVAAQLSGRSQGLQAAAQGGPGSQSAGAAPDAGSDQRVELPSASTGNPGVHPMSRLQRLQAEQAAGASHKQMTKAGLQASSTPADKPDSCGIQGQAFCFLPLPVYTSLPVHVNGYFELSSNRRDIWFGGDMSGSGKFRSDWNLAMLQDAVAPTFARLLLYASQVAGLTPAYTSLFPNLLPGQPWGSLVQSFYQKIAGLPIVRTAAEGGRWLKPADALLMDASCQSSWELHQAILHIGMPLCSNLSAAVVKLMLAHTPGARAVTPAAVRAHLRQNAQSAGLRLEQVNVFLEYCLLDVDTSDAESVVELAGLPVPLASGQVGVLSRAEHSTSDPLFVAGAAEQELFKQQAHLLVTPAQGSDVERKLLDAASSGWLDLQLNLQRIKPSTLASTLLPTVLEFGDRKRAAVAWEEGQPSSAWLQQLWDLLVEHPDLRPLEGWPLLPVAGPLLARLHPASQVVKEGSWAEAAGTAISKLGCRLLDASNINIKHPQIDAYVHEADAGGILSAVAGTCAGDSAALSQKFSEAGLTALQRHQLRTFLLQRRWFLGGLSPENLLTLKALPVFPTAQTLTDTLDGTHNKELEEPKGFVNLLQPRYLAPEGVAAALLGANFVMASSPAEEQLLHQQLGCEYMSQADFSSRFLVARVSSLKDDARTDAMLRVLRNLPELEQHCPAILAELGQIAFVPTASGDPMPPSQLYSPRDSELMALLNPQTSFPIGKFAQNDELLAGLVKLGLKSSISGSAILDAARGLDASSAQDVMARQRATALLSQLDKLAQKGNAGLEAGHWDALLNMAWCPVLTVCPAEGAPWPTGQRGFSSPRLVRPAADLWVVASAMHLLDGSCSDALAERLGWVVPPPSNVIAGQLFTLGKMYPQVQDAKLRDTLQQAAFRIYGYMMQHVGTDSQEVISTVLEGSRCIWTGAGFADAQQVVMEAPVDMRPLLWQTGELLQPFKELLACLGVAPTWQPSHCMRALDRLKQMLGDDILPEHELQMALQLAEHLGMVKGTAPALPGTVWLPDEEGRLAPAASMHYNDAPWLLDSALRLVNKGIPNPLADQLGVQSLRFHHQMSTKMTTPLPCPSAKYLAGLLEGLQSPLSMLLGDVAEMADAAGCESLEVVLDQRQHGQQSLLHPGLAGQQGPALCFRLQGVVLSAQELCEMQTPQQPYKLRGVTCHSGDGLLNAYAIADVISAVSGPNLMIWDPKGCHIGAGRGQEAAGKQFKHVGSDLPVRFADQFAVWDFGQGVSTASPDTLIRVPLRTEDTCSVPEVEAELERFGQYIGKMLLFLRSLRVVRVLTWAMGAMTSQQTFRVTLTPQPPGMRVPFEERDWRNLSLGQGFSQLVRGKTGQRKVAGFTLLQTDGEGRPQQQRWLVSVVCAGGASRDMALKWPALHLDPTAGVAVHLRQDRPVSVQACSGLFLPVPLYLPELGQSQDLLRAQQLHCLTRLPFVVFGSFKTARVGSRRLYGLDHTIEMQQGAGVPNKLSADEKRAAFNQELLSSCAGAAWLHAFESLREQCILPNGTAAHASGLYNMLPTAADVTLLQVPLPDGTTEQQPDEPHVHTAKIVSSFCQKLLHELGRRAVWQSGLQFLPLAEGCFLQGDLEDVGPAAQEFIRRALPLLNVPWHVKEALEAAGIPGLKEVTPTVVRPMLKKLLRSGSSRPQLNALEAAELLKFCFQDLWEQASSARQDPTEGTPAASTAGPGGSSGPQLPAFLASIRDTGTVQALLGRSDAATRPEHSQQPQAASDAMQGSGGPWAGGHFNPDKVQECKGLPVPTATGRIVSLGSTRMFTWSPAASTTPLDVLPADSGVVDLFLHPQALGLLHNWVQSQPLADAWRLPAYSLTDLAQHMGMLLPANWWRQSQLGDQQSLQVPWRDGQQGGPSPEALRQLWALLKELRVPQGTGPEAEWTPLEGWPLLPTTAGSMVRLRHCCCVLTPPKAALSSPQKSQTLAEVSDPAAGADADREAGIPAPGPSEAVGSDAGRAAPVAPDVRSAAESDSEASSEGEHAPLLPDDVHVNLMDQQEGLQTHDAAQQQQQLEQLEQQSEHQVEAGSQLPAAEAEAAADQMQLGEPWNWLVPMFERLGCPVLDARFHDKCAAACNSGPVRAELPDMILAKMRLCNQQKFFVVADLSTEDRDTLRVYFSHNLPVHLRDEETMPALCSLPMLRNLQGHHIAANVGAVVAPQQVLRAVVGDLMLPPDLLASFLKDDPAVRPLFDAIGVPQLTETRLLEEHLLGNWHLLGTGLQAAVLQYIVRQWQSGLAGSEPLKEKLAALAFVPDRNEELKRPCQLYDPSHVLLNRVFGKGPDFPSGQFATEPWLKVLRAVGLQTELSQNVFKAAAEAVQARYNAMQQQQEKPPQPGQLEDILETGGLLTQHYIGNMGAYHTNQLYAAIRELTFVPALKGVPSGAAARPVLTSYREAALRKDWHLCWTQLPTIGEGAVPPPFTWSGLGLRSPPIFNIVVQHLQEIGEDGGEAVLSSWPTAAGTPEAVIGKVLEYLSAEGLSAGQRKRLAGAAFIPVLNSTRLVPPMRLFTRLRQDLAPFAFEVPPAFAQHIALLKQLGMQDAPTTTDLLGILEGLHSSMGSAALNINQCRAVMRLLQALCASTDAASVREVQRAAHQGELCVPSLESRLVPARDCVCVSAASNRLLHRIDGRKMVFAHPQLPAEVSRQLAVPLLEAVVCEVLDGQQKLHRVASLQGYACSAVQQLLTSTEFAQGVHAVAQSFGAVVKSLENLSLRQVSTQLGKAAQQLVFVQQCWTRIVLNSTLADVTRQNAPQQVHLYVSEAEQVVIVAEPPASVPLAALLSQAVSRMLGSPVTLPLDALFGSSRHVLGQLRGVLAPGSTGTSTGGTELAAAASAGDLGSPLLPSDATLVQLKPLRPYAAGEICAYKGLLLPAVAAASAAERRAAAQDPSQLPTPGQAASLLYGRIAGDARPPPNVPLYLITVEVTPGEFRDLKSSEVYSFRGTTGGAGEAEAAQISLAASPVPAPQAEPASSPAGPGSRSAGQVQPAGQPGAVSAPEMMAAVRDMLAAADVPLDLERSQLLQQTLELRAQLEGAQSRLATAEQEAEEAQQEADGLRTSWQCRICLSREVDSCMTACGHVLCSDCTRAVRGRCPFCRKSSAIAHLFK